jgi:hypothetical protein
LLKKFLSSLTREKNKKEAGLDVNCRSLAELYRGPSLYYCLGCLMVSFLP